MLTYVLTLAVLAPPVLLYGGVHAGVQRGLVFFYSALLLVIVWHDRRRGRSVRWHPLAAAAAVLSLLSLLQTLPLPIDLVGVLSPATAEAFRATDTLFGVPTETATLTLGLVATRVAAARWWLLALGIMLLAQVLQGHASRLATLRMVLALAGLVLVVALIQSVVAPSGIYGIFEPWHAGARVGPAGPFVSGNHASHFLLLAACTALVMSGNIRTSRRWSLACVAALCVVGILANGSRGALAALVVTTIVGMIYRSSRGRYSAPALAALLLAFTVGALVALESPSVRTFFDLEQLGSQIEWNKLRAQFATLHLIGWAPLTGLGADAFGDVQMALAPTARWLHLSYVENDCLQVLLDFGIVLPSAALIWLLTAFLRRRKRPNETPGVRHHARRRAWLAVLPVLLYAGFSFALPVPAIVLSTVAVFLGLGGSRLRRLPRRRVVDVALVVAVVLFGAFFAVASQGTRNVASTREQLAALARGAPLDGRHLWMTSLRAAPLLSVEELDAIARRVGDLAGTDFGLHESLAQYWGTRDRPTLAWAHIERNFAVRGERGPWARVWVAGIGDPTSLQAVCEAYPHRQAMVFEILNDQGRHADMLELSLALADTPLTLFNRIRAANALDERELARAITDQLARMPLDPGERCPFKARGLAVGGAWPDALAALETCIAARPDDAELLSLYAGWALSSRHMAETTRRQIDAFLSRLNTLTGDHPSNRRRYYQLQTLANARDGRCVAAAFAHSMTRGHSGVPLALPRWAHEACPELGD